MALNLSDIQTLQNTAGLLGLTPTGEPQRAYLFEVNIYGEDPLSDFQFFIKTINIPSQSRDPIIIDYMDEKLLYSGKDSSTHSISMTLWDDQDMQVLKFLNKWMRMQGSSGGEGSDRHPFYTKTIQIVLKDTSDFIIDGTFEYTLAFPTEIGEISLSYESSEIIEIPVTFVFDEKTFDGDRGFGFNPSEILGL